MKTLYLFDNGECTRCSRRDDRIASSIDETLPEHFYEECRDGVLLVFDGKVTDTPNMTAAECDDLGISENQRAEFTEWWTGEMREATPAEVLSVMCAVAKASAPEAM